MVSVALAVTGILAGSALLSWVIWSVGAWWLRRLHRRQQEETFLAAFRRPVGEEERR